MANGLTPGAAKTDAINQAHATRDAAYVQAFQRREKAVDNAANDKQAALIAADQAITELTAAWDEQRDLAQNSLYEIVDLPWEPRRGDDLPTGPLDLDEDKADYAPRFVDTESLLAQHGPLRLSDHVDQATADRDLPGAPSGCRGGSPSRTGAFRSLPLPSWREIAQRSPISFHAQQSCKSRYSTQPPRPLIVLDGRFCTASPTPDGIPERQ